MARRRRVQAVVDDLMVRIASGQIAEGARLPDESQLGERHQVGTDIAREALWILEARGFITVGRAGVPLVAPREQRDELVPRLLRLLGYGNELFDYLTETREIVEPMAAALAAERANRDEVRRIRQAISALADGAGDAPEVRARADIGFHAALAEASHNPVLIALHRSIGRLDYMALRASLRVPGASERTTFWHQHILDAVEAHDRDGARDAMRLHIRQSRADISQAEDQGLLAETSLAELDTDPL